MRISAVSMKIWFTQVAYSNMANATGGPVLGSPPGKVVFGFQKPRQTLKPSGELVQSVEFRTLGILPGKRSQDGQLSVIDGNRYEVSDFCLEPTSLILSR